MTQIKNDIDSQLLYILEKMAGEFEVVKRQGFPSRREYTRYTRRCDVVIAYSRWGRWAQELGIDYNQFDALMQVLKTEGFLEDYDLVSEYM